MAKTRSMTRNQNHDDGDASSSSSSSSSLSSRKRFKTFDNNGVGLWSEVNHDVLFLVMKHLGVIDFLAFSGVCKSWRAFAVSNKKMFMASLPPMFIWISRNGEKDSYCHLVDFQGRSFKTVLPHSAGRICFGLTCGYLILFRRETRDFWLVNPITRHELHFPNYPVTVSFRRERMRGILAFSPSISRWVFAVLHTKLWHNPSKLKMLFCIAGKRRWNHVSSTISIRDLHFFKGKIYTLHDNWSLCGLRLDPKLKGKWALIETKIFFKPDLEHPELVGSGETLYVIDQYSSVKKVLKLDFGEIKWVSPEKTIEEYAFHISMVNYSAAMKPETLLGSLPKYKGDYFVDEDRSRKCMFNYQRMWYFPDDCLNVNLLDE